MAFLQSFWLYLTSWVPTKTNLKNDSKQGRKIQFWRIKFFNHLSSDWIEGWILLECDSMPLRPFRLFLPPNYPSATPTFDVSREWNTGNIGIVSKCLGLNAGFRKKIIQLFDLGYASRLRLIFCISAGFVLCHIFISYVPTVSSLFWLWHHLQIDYLVYFSWNWLIVVVWK